MDTTLRAKFLALLRSRHHSARSPGVFPQGDQPRETVLVVDTAGPHIDLDALRALPSVKVLHGSHLDASGFCDLIKKSKYFDTYDALFVVIPWMKFFLSNSVFHHLHDAKSTETKVQAPTNKEALAGIVGSFNVTKEFKHNFFIHTDYDEFPNCFDSLEFKKPTSHNKISAELARRAVHAGHFLRTTVVSRTFNSNLVFSGVPVHVLSSSRIQSLLSQEVIVEFISFLCTQVFMPLTFK